MPSRVEKRIKHRMGNTRQTPHFADTLHELHWLQIVFSRELSQCECLCTSSIIDFKTGSLHLEWSSKSATSEAENILAPCILI
uniref:Uncharacterized protein n=2 Tax=Wuchereria bancrofti TaxID=6293 RepID=A0A1I8EV08_WUCBA